MKALCGLQQELDLHGLERKDNAAVFGTVKHASVEQCCHIAMNGFHVSSNTTGSLTDRNRTGPAQDFQQFPSSFGEHFPEQFGRGAV